MLRKTNNQQATLWQDQAQIFAALGNKIRLSLITKLSDGQPHSIYELTHGSKLSRQAITKHLLILDNAKIVISIRNGRECRYQFSPTTFDKLKQYLDSVSKQWDQALSRLKQFVES
jgi:DNA-binding transcriptional ArsR family regulator